MAAKLNDRAAAGGKKRMIVGIVRLLEALEIKLQRSLLLGKKLIPIMRSAKEGHFPVTVEDDDHDLKRFMVPLSYLTRPSFLLLLEQAADEYGFHHAGALALPCTPCHLHRILDQERGASRARARRGAHK